MALRWGLLGCARICRRGLIPGIQGSEFGTLDAIASRNPHTASSWATEFGIPRVYPDYQALLDDPAIDAVYIPLPNELHKPWVLAAADAGKHVLCEKPLALDAAEARSMAEHCRSRNVLLMEAFMWRHQPRTLKLLELVHSGRIGELRLIRASFSFPIEPDDWRLDPARGGGALWDVGCYGVSTARLFARSEPVSVRARAHFGASNVDMTLAATLEFPNHLLAQIDCSFEQPYRCAYELVGTQGVIEVPDAYLPPTATPPLATLRGLDSHPVETLRFAGTNQYSAMVDSFAKSVEQGALQTPAEDGVAQMEALEAILEAARLGV